MKRLILMSCFLCFVAITAHAQKVYKQGAIFVIECAGMPAGSYTKILKSRALNTLSLQTSNATVAYKLEIAATDDNAGTLQTWATAGARCARLGGGNWRLPTQRELQLIWIEHEKLKALSGFTPFQSTGTLVYWSATAHTTANQAYIQSFVTGYSTAGYSTTTGNSSLVRCVRDFL